MFIYTSKADLIKFSGARPKNSEILDFAVGEAEKFNMIFFLIYIFLYTSNHLK